MAKQRLVHGAQVPNFVMIDQEYIIFGAERQALGRVAFKTPGWDTYDPDFSLNISLCRLQTVSA